MKISFDQFFSPNDIALFISAVKEFQRFSQLFFRNSIPFFKFVSSILKKKKVPRTTLPSLFPSQNNTCKLPTYLPPYPPPYYLINALIIEKYLKSSLPIARSLDIPSSRRAGCRWLASLSLLFSLTLIPPLSKHTRKKKEREREREKERGWEGERARQI